MNHRPLSLYETLSAVIEKNGDSVAIVYGEQSITYRQLQLSIEDAARALVHLRVGKGDSIAMVGYNSPAFLFCFLATARIGAVFVPINSNLTKPEIAYIVDHSDAKILFYDESMSDIAAAPQIKERAHPTSTLAASLPGVELPLTSDVDAEQDLLIAYTSGSTGIPKAVVMDHRAQIQAAASMAELWEIGPHDTTVIASPMGFLLGLSTSGAIMLLNGAKVVVTRRFHPGEMLEALTRHKASIFHGVPTMYSMMLQYSLQQGREYDLSDMRVMLCSGAPMPLEMVRQFANRFGIEPQNYFGMSECYPMVATYTKDKVARPAGAVGRLVPGAAIKYLDDGRVVDDGGTGKEMLVRGPSMMKRYHKAPDLTASALIDGWFRSGDIGYQDADGYVYITGRAKDLIIRGGANIAPAEVENVLMRHPAVQVASVVGAPDELFGEVPVAFVVTRPGTTASAEELIAFAKQELAEFKVPHSIVFKAELPLGSTGKIDKSALRAIWKEAHA